MPSLPEPKRSPFTGQEWIDEFMVTQAELQAQQFFLCFTLGQIGAVGQYDPGAALDMMDAVAIDVADVLLAADKLRDVSLAIAANARENAERAMRDA